MRTSTPLAVRIDRKLSHRRYRWARRFFSGLLAHDAFGAAASIAFWIFLSLVPLLVLVGFLVGQVARAKGVEALVGPVLDVVPPAAERLVGKELQRLAGGNASVAPVGIAGFLWTASTGLHYLMDVFENAVKARRRRWWRKRAIAVGWLFVGLGAACALAWFLVKTDEWVNPHYPRPTAPTASVSATPVAPSARVSARPITGHGVTDVAARTRSNIRGRVEKAVDTPVEPLVAGVLMLVTSTAFLAGFYRYAVAHPPGVRRHVWPGAIAATVSWLVVSAAFGAYAASIANYALYYGGLAAVAVLLVWLYLSSLSLIVGAEVNAQLEGWRDEV